LIVASKRRGIAMRSACACSTLSIASNSAGCGRSPRSLAAFHVTSTSCHSSVANRNAGDTPLPSRTRASVPASATTKNFCPSGCLAITSRSGNRPRWPYERRLRSVSDACPESRSFCISSNRRAGGTFAISGGARLVGRALVDRHVDLVARRTRGSMRTGSWRKRVTAADELSRASAIGDAADGSQTSSVIGSIQRVDREVAPRRVLGLRAVDVVGDDACARRSPVGLLRRAERRH
jgi:hypothetical protein